MNTTETTTQEKELVITRVFNAPRELVFKAWSDAKHLAQWWGPKGFEMGVMKLDFRPGGEFHYSMKTPDGQTMWGKFIYREIAPPDRLVFVNGFANEKGEFIQSPMINPWPLEILNTVTLTEHAGKTTLTLRGGPINASEEQMQAFENLRASMQQGFKGTFDQLEEYLAQKQA
jgi:uncharacterized protein YndB with AHSA1/START domain